MLASLLTKFVDGSFPHRSDTWEGATQYTKILDIIGGLSAVVENELDFESGRAIAQEYIRQLFDSVCTYRFTDGASHAILM